MVVCSNLSGLPGSLVEDDQLSVSLRSGLNLDAFNRLRVSEPTAIWYDTLQYDGSPLLWATESVGTASGFHSYGDSGFNMSVNSAGDRYSRTVRQPVRYQPGKSRLDVLTWGSPNIPTGVRFRAGAFNLYDGVFVQIEGGQFAVGVRSSVTGTIVDTVIPQSEWNVDKMDGTGRSGIDLNPNAGHIFITDLQWLSLGIVRFAFEINGDLIYVHKTVTGNVIERPYMQTANLPIRYEIESFGGIGSVTAICSASMSEGGRSDEKGYDFGASNGRTPIDIAASDTWTPIMSIRRSELFNGHPYNSANIIPKKFSVYCTTAPMQISAFYRPTLTGGSWNPVNSESGVEYNSTATAMTGGFLIDPFYLQAGGQGSGSFSSAGTEGASILLPIARDPDGSNPDVLTLAARALGTTPGQAYGTISFREIR